MSKKDDQFSPGGDETNPFSHAGQQNPNKPSRTMRILQVGAATVAGMGGAAGLGELARQGEIDKNQAIIDNTNRILQQEAPPELSPTEQYSSDLSRSMDLEAANAAKERINELNDPARITYSTLTKAAGGGLMVGGGFAAATRRRRAQTTNEPSK
jgi:hypothetical protein